MLGLFFTLGVTTLYGSACTALGHAYTAPLALAYNSLEDQDIYLTKVGDKPPPSSDRFKSVATPDLQKLAEGRPQTLKIPFRYVNGFLIVDIIINQRLPLSFIFDTGSKHTILTDELLIPLLGQLPEEKIRLVGSDLSQPITGHIMRRTSIIVGDITLKNQSLILIDGGTFDLSVLAEESLHGILGVGAFGAYALKINYQTSHIELLDPKSIRQNKKAIILPIRVEKSKAYLNVEAEIIPGKTQKLSLLIDTGASLSLLIHTAESDSTLFPAKIVTGTFGYGLGGYLMGYVGRSDLIKLGPFELPDIITHFQIFKDSNNLRDIPIHEGILGNGILDRFTVTIDYSRKEVHLLPTRKMEQRTEYDRSGLRIVRDGEKLNKLRIQHIVADSPADVAGIQNGDELLKVGGIPISLRSLARIEDLLRGRVGKCIRLTVKRNEAIINVSITLQELI